MQIVRFKAGKPTPQGCGFPFEMALRRVLKLHNSEPDRTEASFIKGRGWFGYSISPDMLITAQVRLGGDVFINNHEPQNLNLDHVREAFREFEPIGEVVGFEIYGWKPSLQGDHPEGVV